ncbi:hypothetical protein F5Y17DRAFT_453118 [Xylariaceae sp. FL0594]|nr:hypothetical protein F5Y17DRAFT_453118 [Xylariaceae sp. FL0594]
MKISNTPLSKASRPGRFRSSHTRSITNPEPINFNSSFFSSSFRSPMTFAQDPMVPRRASSAGLDGSALEKYGLSATFCAGYWRQ